MAETSALRGWRGQLTFVLLALAIITLRLLPLNTVPPGPVVPPDLLLQITLVFVTRRPDYLPVTTIAAIFLLGDLLFQNPPGLEVALVIVLTEAMRRRAARLREAPFWIEWMTVTFGIVLLVFARRAVFALLSVPQPGLSAHLSQMVMTILCYPIAVGIMYFGFGLRRPAAGEVNAMGQRL
ncbi:hypothetical protein [Ketogulonicigenium vulgare]|uniref:hypothetical protein n=1 Tax=Ketogulonicigenium vulgare TaxID=92945 RepID=UPI0023594FF8|nr:hypothetical protein [Ketogulonicigenium vulgare]